ncbi:Clp protease N-terminal domain-containing protein [Pseudonocardia sp. N23]|uniref:Clp protease N-terminal domain-containing protein n=1 Tax=Pseudonocardia sp. N23 TaxID=1987376 RepID=UPI000BFE4C1D|nr:Clp protease N-terminal domain-containing protein [Pseudonocardia sp. N23]GAY12305.1 probable ATP-dependent Clp protease ATP-binding subunit [Pseudonocardia sp. N23]
MASAPGDRPAVRLDDLIDTVLHRSTTPDPLDRLGNAVLVADDLGEVADHLVGHFVDQARRAGASWTEIGRAMGVTKQAAQKRFVPRAREEDFEGGPYARFTPRAQATVLAAHEAALRLQEPEVTTQHLVLGLLTEPESIAGVALARLGSDLDRVGDAMEGAAGPAVEEPPTNPPFSGSARKALDLTRREALRLGHNYIGTEHLLLGILSDPADPAATALARLGVDHAAVETFVHEALAAVIAARKPS